MKPNISCTLLHDCHTVALQSSCYAVLSDILGRETTYIYMLQLCMYILFAMYQQYIIHILIRNLNALYCTLLHYSYLSHLSEIGYSVMSVMFAKGYYCMHELALSKETQWQ